jgi:hypothetical protein
MSVPRRVFTNRNKLAVALDSEGRALSASNEPADGVRTFPFVFTFFPGEKGITHMRDLFGDVAVEMRPVKVAYEVELTEAEQREEDEALEAFENSCLEGAES